jgi:hypothetical protein
MGWLNVDIKVFPVHCTWLHGSIEAFGALAVISQPYARILVLLPNRCPNSDHAAVNVSCRIYQRHLLLNWYLMGFILIY